MLSTWIRRFTPDNAKANRVFEKWAHVITRAFAGGTYDHEAYVSAYRETMGLKPAGGRLVDFVNFYPVSLLQGVLDVKTEAALLDYIIGKPDGIYYIYEKRLSEPPACFESRETGRYLAAVELLSGYACAKEKLGFVADWLRQNQKADGTWDLGPAANDKVYLPLSDSWRKKKRALPTAPSASRRC